MCEPVRARQSLDDGKTAVYRRSPPTIILKRKVDQLILKPFRLKFESGSKTTGMTVIEDPTGDVAWCVELEHWNHVAA